VQAGELTPIQAVQTRGRWRWWALLIVVALAIAAVVGVLIAIADANDDAAAVVSLATLVVRGVSA